MPTPKPFLTWLDNANPETSIEVTARTPLEAARLYAQRTYDIKRGSCGLDVLVRNESSTWIVHIGIDVEVTFAPSSARRIK